MQPNCIEMKKNLFLIAMALMMVACGQKDNTETNPSDKKEVLIPQNEPVVPAPQIPSINTELTLETNQDNQNTPVLRIEEGKPLDLSQLLGGGMSVGDQVASQIDTIQYKAEHGVAEFQYVYGVCYEKGWGVEKDMKQALAWYNKAAEQKNGLSYNALGNAYRMGNGVNVDPKKAFEYYQKGASEKDAQAMLNLGNCYYYGMGTEKDEKAAIKLWTEAAEADNEYAMAQMGDCYFYGFGVEKNLAKAIDYYTSAADKNVTSALYRLGILYYTGNGIGQDQTYAKILLQKASNGGLKEAQDFLDKNFKD